MCKSKVKAKNISIYTILLLSLALCLVSYTSYGQDKKTKSIFNQAVLFNKHKDIHLSDSLKARRDSIHRADSLHRIDSISLQKQSSLDAPAFSSAKDSVVQDFSNGKRKVYYYGDVVVRYGNLKLTADFMEYDMLTGTVHAKGRLDTLSNQIIGMPTMTEGNATYKMKELKYNFKTRKAIISNMVTQQDEGLLQGNNIKMMPDKSINITDGKYTVCDLEHPHYYLSLTAAKVITKPSRKTVFGPAWAVVEDVPLPIVLPFGFVPKRPQRATGLLMPTFGEEVSRGFYMRDLGMYFVFGDHFDLSVTGDVYTLGSWSVDINSRYKVLYKFNGNFAFTYSNDQSGEKGSPDFFQSRNLALRWSHQQDPKFMPGTSFSASVNFSSPSNNRYNSRSVTEALQNQASSSISFSKNWNGKANLSLNLLHNQNSRDSSYSFSLPNISLSVPTFYPFRRKNRVGKERVYEKISFGYNTSLQNRISFKAREFNKPGFYDKFKTGMNHRFSIGLPSFTLANYFNFNPSISYGQNWYFRKSSVKYNPKTNRVERIEGKQLNSFGISQSYSGSMSMSTRIYGTFNFGKIHRIQAIRHVISPSISFSVSPELGTYANGWRTYEYTDKDGKQRSYDYNIYAGQLNSPPGKGKTASASISIGNNLEAKVRNLRDTTGKGVQKIKLIDQFNISTGYNFLADSLNMSNIGVSMSTSLFSKVNVSANMNFDPYALNANGRRINKFNFVQSGYKSLARLTSASASLSYSISGQGHINGNDGTKNFAQSPAEGEDNGHNANPSSFYQRRYYHPLTGEYIPGGWLYYTNPNVPWSLNINYNISLFKSYNTVNNKLVEQSRITQTLGLSGNVKITPQFSINASSGIDIMQMKLTTTQLSATYDLHCFNISISWVPTGTWQSWSFRIAANAAALADLLKFKKSASYWDR